MGLTPESDRPFKRSPESQALLERSGNFTTRDNLVAFLYELMRDEVPLGVVEQIVLNSQPRDTSDGVWSLTNGYLGKYAEDIAARLRISAPSASELAVAQAAQTVITKASTLSVFLEHPATNLSEDARLAWKSLESALLELNKLEDAAKGT